jgi:hypothetical protein
MYDRLKLLLQFQHDESVSMCLVAVGGRGLVSLLVNMESGGNECSENK